MMDQTNLSAEGARRLTTRADLTLLHQQNQLLARIANSLETLAAIAQAEHEASDTGESEPLTDLAGRPVR